MVSQGREGVWLNHRYAVHLCACVCAMVSMYVCFKLKVEVRFKQRVLLCDSVHLWLNLYLGSSTGKKTRLL